MSAQEALSAGALLASGTVNTLLNARVLGLGCYAAESLLQTAAKLAAQSAVVGVRALRSRGAARASGGGGGGGGASWRTRAQLVGSAVCDLVGFLLYQQGLVRCGPALYQVACSAQVVFGVAFSAAFVGARYSLGQLVAVAWVVGSIAARGALAARKAGAADEGDAGAVTFGILMVLLGCAVYSAGAVLVTRMNRDCVRAGETPPSGSDVSAANGVVGLCFILVYLAAYTVPRWTELVTDVQAASGVTPWEVLSTHAIYLACYVVHNANYWNCVASAGVTTAQCANAVRTVSVALVSAAVMCRGDTPAECLDAGSMACALATAGGGAMYALATSRASATKATLVAKKEK